MAMVIDAVFRNEDCILDPEWDCIAIKYDDFKVLLSSLPYASCERVMTLMLAFTGCRVSELNNMFVQNLTSSSISWQCGKNQKGMRREALPECYIEELRSYRASYRCNSVNLFHCNHITYRRHFNCLREKIGGRWCEREYFSLQCHDQRMAFKLKFKGFRKTFQTILMKYYYDKYRDAGVALEMVSKRMRHSSERITAYHYIENFEVINVSEWVNNFFCKKPSLESQTRLGEFWF